MDLGNQIHQALVTLIGAVVTGGVAIIGALANAYVAKIKKNAKDYSAAEEKIRQLQRRLSLPESGCLKSADAIHDAIRDIEKKVNDDG